MARDEPSGGAGSPGLRRAIGRGTLTLFVLGDVLGAGIYVLVGQVADEVGGAVWLAFAVALLLALFTACSYAELVTKYPGAGGAALYVERAFGRHLLTFMVMFAVMLSGITSAATLSRAFAGDYLGALVDVPTLPVALGFIVVVALINARGITESVRLNVGLTVIELGGLLLIVVVGAAALGDGLGDPGRALEISSDDPAAWAVLAGASLAFYALIGFEDSVNVSEEARDPRRDYPRALFAALAAAGLVYVAVSVVAAMVVPTATLAGSSGPLLEVTSRGPLAIPDRVFSVIALLAVSNGALINMIMASRLLYGMGNAGIVPAALAAVHPGRQTPLVAIALTTALAMGLIALGDLSSLADTTVVLLLLVFSVVNVAVLALRRDPVDHPHFRTPRAFPLLGLVVTALLLVRSDGASFALAVPLLAAGLVVGVVAGRAARSSGDAARHTLRP